MSTPRSTLAASAVFAIEVRKSRFVAHAAPVTTPQAALDYIDSIADRTATHNCWAYRIGPQYRFSDDGEPAGTAGKPILQAVDGQGMDQVAVVVTRWFGGIKLGAGGLARAYGGCAAECLRTAARALLVETVDVEFELAFALLPLVQARLAGIDATSLDEAFGGDGVTVRVRLPSARVEALRVLLADLSRGRSRVRRID